MVRSKLFGVVATLSLIGLSAEAAHLGFDNPGFEDTAKRGKVNECVEIGPFGVNGNGGLRVRPEKKSRRYVWTAPLAKDVELEIGKPYMFEADMLGHGKAHTVTAVEVFDPKTGKYDHGFWGETCTKLDNGWTHHVTKFIPKVSNRDYSYRFIIFAQVHDDKKDVVEGSYTDVDNLALAEDKPEWECCNVWPTHFKVFTDRGRVRFSTNFIGPFLPKDGEPLYRTRLLKPDGTVLARDERRPDAQGVFTTEFGKLGYEGPVKLVVELWNAKTGTKAAEKSFDLVAAPVYRPAKGEIFVQENGVPLVDGKPYMPIAIYCNFVDPKEFGNFGGKEAGLKECADLGFDLLYDYGTYKLTSEKARAEHYALVAKYGLRTLADDFSKGSAKQDLADPNCQLRKKARELKSYPAVLGFYTMDEAGPEVIEPLTRVRRALNEECPGHIVTTCNIFSPFTYLSTADVAGGDKYPIDCGERDLTDMDNYGKKLAATSALGWHAPQILNWANTRFVSNDREKYLKSGREPMENEMLSVALMYASYGVKGFAFYSYFDMYRGAFPEWIPLRRERVRGVVKDLRSLEPFIVGGQPIEEIPHADTKGKTRIVALADGKGAYKVLVIGIKRDNSCTFTLPAKYGRLVPRKGNVKLEGGTYSFGSKEFVCDILD